MEQTVTRQKQNRTDTASMRASETAEQTVNRHEHDKLRQARKRSLEKPQQVLQRKETNKDRMSCKRSRGVSVEEAISAFHSETRAGSDFVCTCCHRMMYRKSVVQCKKAKYTKASPDLLENVFSANLGCTSSDGKEWVCKTWGVSIHWTGTLDWTTGLSFMAYNFMFSCISRYIWGLRSHPTTLVHSTTKTCKSSYI